MKLIIGLGNPDAHFCGTRHNIGRDIVEAFRTRAALPAFRFESKWKAHVTEGKVEKEKATLVLPDTYMNRSGAAVGPLARFWKIKPTDIILVHDDADIPLGRAKLSFGKRSAGHKGVESVIRALKTTKFWRFRIGIAGKRNIPAERIVLKKYTPEETRTLKKVARRTLDAIETAITETPERAMNTYNAA